MANSRFSEDIFAVVAQIPSGRIMTYGQIAALCGHPGAARVVGQVAHFGPSALPWHRVVNAKGGLASRFVPNGRAGQARLLSAEGVVVLSDVVSIKEYLWWPSA